MEQTETSLENEKVDLSNKSLEIGENIVKPINKETIHKICSGQVVLSLAVAVKELVENALDAGATIIDVKLKEHGSELIEVSDDGFGVVKKNFAALTQKHCTSKITDFSDLETVKTLGFRGEALSSLCALSNVTITTRHVTASVGTKITYDHNGAIVDECTAPRLQGTTVSLANLFCTLPVRRKEFLKNLKREFTKMCQLLYAYCMVSVGVKITCFNQTPSGAKAKVVSTQGLLSVRDNIINIFGAKQISSLIEMTVVNPEENILQEYGIQISPNEEIPFKIDCFISSAMHGSGRSSTDRQYFFINSRPCEPVSVIKLCNEIYRQYNCNQYPFIYMNILTSSTKVDVNVTPDKRQIFLEKEKLLLSVIKASLIESFKNFPSTYNVQNLNITTRSEKNISKFSARSPMNSLKRLNSDSILMSLDVAKKKAKTDEAVAVGDLKAIFSKFASRNVDEKTKKDLNQVSKADREVKEEVDSISYDHNTIENKISTTMFEQTNKKYNNPDDRRHVNSFSKSLITPVENNTSGKCKEEIDKNMEFGNDYQSTKPIENENPSDISFPEGHEEVIACNLLKTPMKEFVTDLNMSTNTSNIDEKQRSVKIESNVLEVSLSEISKRLKKQLTCKTDDEKENTVLFRTQISPSTNQAAEQELQKRITKDKFKEMEILGQFNLGFIISRLGNDLFIIDQHATDEKYNFEQLQLNTVLKTQVLVSPKHLHLTPDKECLLIENIEIFRKNGFVFDIDESADPSNKVKLTAIPISKNYSFGVDDIDELLFMLQDSSHTMCRPTRVRQMFASRACRKSVMIGKALTYRDMQKLVDHMGEIDQPWNCPHGRPTMRHLLNLNLIHSE